MNESIEFFGNTCPLTGIPTEGRATVKPVGVNNDVLYAFAPIGKAVFSLQTALVLGQRIRQGDLEPRLDLAGLSRQAAEKGEPPLIITSEVFGAPRTDVPNTFEEKREHFLQLLYDAGGNEYRERTINTFEDFPMAFASGAEQLFRIMKSLVADGLIKYDIKSVVQGDWVRNIQANYHGVLLTATARHLLSRSKPTVAATTAAIIPQGLATLHPTIQLAASSLFATSHYPQAILAACTALDKAVQAKAQLPPTTVGTALMTTAFSAKSPLIQLSQDTNEQMGFMNLYQGSVQAIRNHYAHNLTEIPAARAIEWLGFISALFYKLDEN